MSSKIFMSKSWSKETAQDAKRGFGGTLSSSPRVEAMEPANVLSPMVMALHRAKLP